MGMYFFLNILTNLAYQTCNMLIYIKHKPSVTSAPHIHQSLLLTLLNLAIFTASH